MAKLKKQNETELLLRAQQGDKRAFERLVETCDRKVYALIISMVNHPVDAQDIYQDTFLKAYTALPQFRLQSSFSTWVMRIAVNQSLNHRRFSHRLQMFENNNLDDTLALLADMSDDKNPEADLNKQEMLNRIYAAMHKLSNRERAVFSLKYLQEFKIKEIASVLNCADGTVKNLLFRATKKMQQQLLVTNGI